MEDRKAETQARGFCALMETSTSPKPLPKRPSGNVAKRTPGKPSACESCGWPES
jgi:hypothetical protein